MTWIHSHCNETKPFEGDNVYHYFIPHKDLALCKIDVCMYAYF
jgi:hypothetical protein